MAITSMADAYYELIKANKRTMKQVPTEWKVAVQAKIDEAASNISGQQTAPQ